MGQAPGVHEPIVASIDAATRSGCALWRGERLTGVYGLMPFGGKADRMKVIAKGETVSIHNTEEAAWQSLMRGVQGLFIEDGYVDHRNPMASLKLAERRTRILLHCRGREEDGVPYNDGKVPVVRVQHDSWTTTIATWFGLKDGWPRNRKDGKAMAVYIVSTLPQWSKFFPLGKDGKPVIIDDEAEAILLGWALILRGQLLFLGGPAPE